ncbi:MAG: transposase [Planctomycetales bacterium]|nr:transposase [Planctomycetales bacterium]
MQFCFYPKHEHGCPHISHCPHLGGAALSTVVMIANESGDRLDYLHRTIDAERKTISRLVEENQQLRQELEQAKLELKLERQNRFATNEQKEGNSADDAPSEESVTAPEPKKRGAPAGHPGWFRPTPTRYDWLIEVPAPCRCPHCHGKVTSQAGLPPVDHLQEDIIDNVYRVVCYRHATGCCDDCGGWVEKAGKDEILGSRIGPYLRSRAVWLRNMIGISYRKVPQVIQELYDITFTPAALIGFETMLAEKAEPVVDDIAKKLASSDGPVHADETYWTTDGVRTFFWMHGDEKYIHFQYDTSRAGQVSRDILRNAGTVTSVYLLGVI